MILAWELMRVQLKCWPGSPHLKAQLEKLLPRWPTHMAVGRRPQFPPTVGRRPEFLATLDLLSVLVIRQLVFSRVSDPRE